MKKLLIFLMILSTLLITGCWDMVEIEDRIYPYTVGVDLNHNMDKEGKYEFTITYPNIAAIGKNASSEDPIYLVDDTANSIFELLHKLTTRLQRPIYLKLLNVITLSEEVSRDSKSMREIVDSLNRDFLTSKNVQMLVVRDSSKELLNIALASKRQQNIEGVLYNMLVNRQQASMFTPINFIDFIEEMDISDAAIVPVGAPGKEEIIVNGGALFKNYSLIGYLEPMEVRALAIINDEINEDTVDIDFNGADLSVMITGVKSKRKLENEEENLKIIYDIELEGHIHSFILDTSKTIETEETLEDMQTAIAEDIKGDIEMAVKKVQKEYKADVLNLRNYINKYHPIIWDKIKNDWEVIYPEIEIEVNVKVFIRRRGLTT